MTAEPIAAIGQDGRHLYTCPLCEAMGGLEIHVEGAGSPGSVATATTPSATATCARRAFRPATGVTMPKMAGRWSPCRRRGELGGRTAKTDIQTVSPGPIGVDVDSVTVSPASNT